MDNNQKVKFTDLKFKQKDALGSGFFGEVFRVTDGKIYDDRFVAKVFNTPKVLALINRIGYGVSFERETMALKFLGPKNVSPKIYYEINTFSKRYYVMEAMDETLDEILKPGLCVLLECIMRFYNESNTNTYWFLDSIQALTNNIEKL